MIQVYGQASSCSTRVLWALEESGADYVFIPIDLRKGEGKYASYLKLNPGGKVPTLVHNDLVLTESAAICAYIADLFPESNLIPAYQTPDRALYYQSCYFAMTELEQPLWNIAKHRFALPKEFRIRDMLKTATYEFEQALEVLSQRLGEREFLVGEHFTCADLITASILNWAKQGGKRALSLQHDNIEHYLERMFSREALLRAQQREQEH
jgi:glutathione S-transferase